MEFVEGIVTAEDKKARDPIEEFGLGEVGFVARLPVNGFGIVWAVEEREEEMG